ncbi:BTB/POZ and MATH domain-containing protein 2 [Rhynchospora pubera]|uniref:BTB/POZ and MATH domain-containing protein 2 n=1 Tax=Rhynchospora pubera TaxID=906938 RepID=A0AAV8F097_9POAL|nr:BTB/POZ and MATH domain-containing protein 2 [Rhynchospora pubera]
MLRSSSLGVFPHSLAEEFRVLLESQEETDVTFELEGEIISAHRLILACCSPVFRAELFGSMVETNCKCIKIVDMKPLVFRGMLHYMYTDSLPDIEDLVSGVTSDMNVSSTILYQHLLVAADRYALEGLKALCEMRLRKTISVDTVVSFLALADQHNSIFLKEGCLEFIAEPKNFVKVALTKEYASLGNSCPLLLDELRRKVESAANEK